MTWFHLVVAATMAAGLPPAAGHIPRPPSHDVRMDTARNHRLIDLWYRRMWNTWDKTAIAEICAPDVTFRGSLGTTVRGHAGVAAYMDQIRAAFPDFTNTVEEIISEDDKAFARLTYVGTQKGAVLGVAPTGKRVTYAGAAVFTFQGDRISDVWVLGDLHALLTQLKETSGR